jgi:hypothetical protein
MEEWEEEMGPQVGQWKSETEKCDNSSNWRPKRVTDRACGPKKGYKKFL